MREVTPPSADMQMQVPHEMTAGVPQRGRSGRWKAIGATALVLVAALAWFGPTLWRMVDQQGRTIAPPNALGTLKMRSDVSAEYLSTFAGVLERHGLGDAVVAAYTYDGEPLMVSGSPNLDVYFAASSDFVLQPEKRLDTILTYLMTAGDSRADKVHLRIAVKGPVGVHTKCGTLNDGPNPGYFVCGWADYGGVGFLFFDRQVGFDTGIEMTLRFRQAALT